MLTGALMGGPVGMIFHGTAIAYLEHATRFLAPVRIGDTLTTTWTVTALLPKPAHRCGIVTLAARAQNQDGVYGGCTVRCELGPHCGDGLVQGSEQCDPGAGMSMAVVTTKAGCTSSNSTCDENCRAAPIR